MVDTNFRENEITSVVRLKVNSVKKFVLTV
jgi:hypothetical protein